MTNSAGFHHVTLVSGDPKENVAFYTKVLGLRLIKKTVNFDDPGTWHLYYADETGRPGTVLTIFPFPNTPRAQPGPGFVRELRFAVGAGMLAFWHQRLLDLNVKTGSYTAFTGDKYLKFADPDGLPLAIIESQAGYEGYACEGLTSPQAIRGFAGMSLWAGRAGASARTLEALGFTQLTDTRFITQDHQVIDIEAGNGAPVGRSGAGSVHHVAFRASSDEQQAELVSQVRLLGLQVTEQVERNYFRSVYFREPSGILYEIATDDPGFLIDETAEELGAKLQLPPWFEQHRAEITNALAPLS
jgi:glyoxalase family protein